jgi:hypothetical protein
VSSPQLSSQSILFITLVNMNEMSRSLFLVPSRLTLKLTTIVAQQSSWVFGTRTIDKGSHAMHESSSDHWPIGKYGEEVHRSGIP